MDNLNSLVCRIIDTVPMSEEELWALKGSTHLGAMVYKLGSTKMGDVADDAEFGGDLGMQIVEDLWGMHLALLTIEQHKPVLKA